MLAGEDDPDVLTCRAIWSIIKEHRISVRIPFAMRIKFSSAANRRNPAMLFDLIKCHATLRFLQRGGEAVDGEVRIGATRADFDAAARLYGAINQEIGGQESKMTKNEAAGLATIARMGWETFTIRMLQQATGLSYHQVRRILQGYTAKGTTYCGLLEKCPALSVVDATVVDDTSGMVIRRHEAHFQSDAGCYREWVAGLAVWLEDDPDGPDDTPGDFGSPDVCTFAPDLHSDPACGANENALQNTDSSSIREICTEICTDTSSSLHHLPGTESPTGRSGSPTPGARDICSGVNIPAICEDTHPIINPPPSRGLSGCKIECKDVQTSVKVQTTPRVNPRDYIALPVAKDEPCHICGRRPTSSVLRGGGGKYLCYDCLSKAKRPAKVQPLPGVLDHRTFSRVRADLGRCDICGKGKTVYRSREAQAGICEGCYARLVREWNAKAGVR